MSRPIHFEIHADDPERAIEFYNGVFGWEIKKWDSKEIDYWLVMTGDTKKPGIDGGLIKRQGPPPSDDNLPVTSWVNTIDIENLDEMMEKVKGAGGKIVTNKMAVPTVGWMCYAKDTEGNIFGMMQSDESAK